MYTTSTVISSASPNSVTHTSFFRQQWSVCCMTLTLRSQVHTTIGQHIVRTTQAHSQKLSTYRHQLPRYDILSFTELPTFDIWLPWQHISPLSYQFNRSNFIIFYKILDVSFWKKAHYALTAWTVLNWHRMGFTKLWHPHVIFVAYSDPYAIWPWPWRAKVMPLWDSTVKTVQVHSQIGNIQE